VFSIGVLHHLEDPAAGFRILSRLLRPGGRIAVWVYGCEGNAWIVRWVNPLRVSLFNRLPRGVLYAVAWAVAFGLFPLARLISVTRWGTTGPPMGRYGIQYCQHVIFDQLVAPVAHYLMRQEFEAWFLTAGLADVVITSRHGTGWRGTGVRPILGEGDSRASGDQRGDQRPAARAEGRVVGA
jgi:SAM-dependent methyltransferase